MSITLKQHGVLTAVVPLSILAGLAFLGFRDFNASAPDPIPQTVSIELFLEACSGLLLSVILIALYVTRVHRRLSNLTYCARRLARGKDLDRAPAVTDEVGRLHSIIYDMAQARATTLRREHSAIKNAVDVVCSISPSGFFTKISPACMNVWGYRPHELVGHHFSTVVLGEDVKATSGMLEHARQGHAANDFENRCLHKNGSLTTMSWSAFVSELGDVVFCVAHDITERKQTELQTWHKAYHDALTGLPNRLLFYDRLHMAAAMARRETATMAVMFMDLDRFKAVNDTLGHDAGDALLNEVAARLTGCLRRSDTVARLGGDEFTVLLPKIAQPEDAALVARKINESLGQPWMYGDRRVQISGSIGIAVYPKDADEVEDLLKRADTAQYQIKSKEKNGFAFYEPHMIKIERPDTDRSKPLERTEAA